MSGICKGTIWGTEMEKSPVLTVYWLILSLSAEDDWSSAGERCRQAEHTKAPTTGTPSGWSFYF